MYDGQIISKEQRKKAKRRLHRMLPNAYNISRWAAGVTSVSLAIGQILGGTGSIYENEIPSLFRRSLAKFLLQDPIR
jgi:hypothetical protein